MNVSSILGFLAAAWVIQTGVFAHAAKPEIFLDSHAMILVVGGTLSAGLIAFPLRRFWGLVRLLVHGVILKGHPDHRRIVIDILSACVTAYHDHRMLFMKPANHPFLAEGYRLIADSVLSEKELEEVLRKRTHHFKQSYMEDAKMLNALAKFPPAFGLLGATTGMIAMMTNLGAKGGQDAIGPSMAIALVATFWGIAVANLILLPLSDYAVKVTTEDHETRVIIMEGLMLLKRKATPQYMAEVLNSYLPIQERIELKADIMPDLSKEIQVKRVG